MLKSNERELTLERGEERGIEVGELRG